jgi:hypothetical protein
VSTATSYYYKQENNFQQAFKQNLHIYARYKHARENTTLGPRAANPCIAP